MDLNQFLRIIRNMGRRPFKPHRYLALLAILDIIENQENPQKQFYYNETFKHYFTKYFEENHSPNDRNKPFKPFFYLKNAGIDAGGFWLLRTLPGTDLNNLEFGFSERELIEIVEYAELDQELFEILSDEKSGQESREIVRNEIKKCLKAGVQTNL